MIQQLKWEKKGLLEVDDVTGTLHWTQEVDPSCFEKEFPSFITHAQEWSDILMKELAGEFAS
jgi:hypothetical protein